MYFHPQGQGQNFRTQGLPGGGGFPGGGFPGGFPGGGNVDRRLDRLEREVTRLNNQVERLDRRVDRIERRLGIRTDDYEY
ncbi:hypothetical protein [Bacillus sp. T33-2]|uniref:hypothetical protein n=1 Tax=Bacillus sp. T33-2 TaxID=2054168 RepID=UPI000C785705|nr:hypothetical protein [Bacillus sp. T33-2]PLR98197.1 hypothetical protein CVD19_06275 [Bacillus sp. T33-2]